MELTELQKLKVENFKLRVTVAQLNATIVDRNNELLGIQLTKEQLALTAELEASAPAHTFDWDKAEFVAKPEPEAPPS